MARNLKRISNYYQWRQALDDWAYVARKARDRGELELVANNTPGEGAGVKAIDKCIGAIRAEFDWPEVYLLREQDAAKAESH